MKTAKIGLIGLGVMGANLARNISNKGFTTVVYNRTTETMEKFIAEHGNERLFGEAELTDFINSIERPRKIIVLVKAGAPVDKVIESIQPYLDEDDMIIDCGNSYYLDTQRRSEDLQQKNIHFIGCGVSGGEEGALNGPSLMPGGSKKSWEDLQPILAAIAAKDFNGGPCVTHIASGGSGHYVKMVHNGIEYAVMQMMADAYELLRTLYKLPANEISQIFAQYQAGKLNSYLFEIAVEVLKKEDEFEDGYLIDYILDRAGNKGTGKWTAVDALNRGVGLPAITAAVHARYNSAYKPLRQELSKIYAPNERNADIPLQDFVPILENALYAGMLSAYAEGYHLIQVAAEENNWDINLSEVARIWEGGCIIRAQILNLIHEAYQSADRNTHLLAIKSITEQIAPAIPALKEVVAYCADNHLQSPALAAGLYYFISMTSQDTSANFIQGLRDYFGAHTYQRIDREGTYHTQWIN